MVFYFVQRGETLYAIAKRYQTTVHAIVSANRLDDPNDISPGQALIIPRPGEVPSPPPGGIVHLVRPGETIFHLASRFGATPADILKANQIAHPEFILPGQQLVIPELAAAGDDWPMYGRTPGRTGAGPIKIDGSPIEAWGFTPRRKSGVRPSAPVVRYDRVFVGLGDGQFHSMDRHTGRGKWRVAVPNDTSWELPEGCCLPAPAVHDGLAYLSGADGQVAAVDAYTGKPVWRVRVSGPPVSSPGIWNGVVYLGCWTGHVYALETKTGAIAWKTRLDGRIIQPVAVGDGRVLVVTSDGVLWCLDAESGKANWIAQANPAHRPIWADVIVVMGERAFDPANGQLLWEVDAGGRGPVVDEDLVVYPGASVDLFTGALSGVDSEVPAGVTVLPPPPVALDQHIVSGKVLIGICGKQLCAWCLPDRTHLWAVELPAASLHPPAVAPGQLFVSCEDGSIRAYRFASGRRT